MPEQHGLDQTAAAFTADRPICPLCGKQMEFDHAELHRRFIGTVVRVFKCACGVESSHIFKLASETDSTQTSLFPATSSTED
jgi:hypothetical protein